MHQFLFLKGGLFDKYLAQITTLPSNASFQNGGACSRHWPIFAVYCGSFSNVVFETVSADSAFT